MAVVSSTLREFLIQLNKSTMDQQLMPFLEDANWAPNDQDIKLIGRSWCSEQAFLIKFGLNVNLYLFRLMPEVKIMFTRVLSETEINPADGEPTVTFALKQQALRLAEVIDFAVRNIQAVNKEALTFAISDRIQSTDNAGFDLGSEEKEAAINAWKHLIVFITRKVYIGFCTQKKASNSSTGSVHSHLPVNNNGGKRFSLPYIHRPHLRSIGDSIDLS